MLHPLKFKPCFWPKIWGGRLLQQILGMPLPDNEKIGESWGLYDFPPGSLNGHAGRLSATVACGPLAGLTLNEVIGRWGRAVYGSAKLLEQDQFPLVIKFLDASDTLSVQVHPHKNEAWYILHAEADASIYLGFKRGVGRSDVVRALADGAVADLLNRIPARPGQTFYIPRGTVHALGAGILAAEVQTPSPVVYRLYDWGRHENGQPRQLHIEDALDCIDYAAAGAPLRPTGHTATPAMTVSELVACPFFSIRRVQCSGGCRRTLGASGTPAVWTGLKGRGSFSWPAMSEPLSLGPGDVVLLPAEAPPLAFEAHADCTWLETTVPAAA